MEVFQYTNNIPNVLVLLSMLLCIALIVLVINLLKIKSKLKEQENRLRTIFESEPDCVKLQAMDGSVLDMNSAGLAILEANDISDIKGRTVYEFINSEHHKSYRELTERVFKGSCEMMEFKIHSKNGQERWLETKAVPLKDQQDNITSLLAITRDITKRKQLEKKLKQRQMDLERVCRVSTMGEVASGIAHEINQPLCAISSYSETCITSLDSNNTKELKENLKLIFEQSQKASDIVSWIRELAANKKSDLQEINLNELIEEFCSYVEFFLEKNHVKLYFERAKQDVNVYADRVQLEHVLINLVKNSVDSMASNSFNKNIQIYIDATSQSGFVTVLVKDKGVGIKESNINKVTNPYFTTRNDGLGMGLPISKSIIKAHNGDLWIKSSSKFGTTIAFSLATVGEHIRDVDEQCA